MIVIYSQEQTYIVESAMAAKPILIELYGEKLGNEACDSMKNAREGDVYRKHGGPLVKMVSKDAAKLIREKEVEIRMMSAM